MFLSKVPETIFINANRSLCFGSILACILNTNPVKSFSFAFTNLSSDIFGLGVGAISIKQSNNSRTPKLFNAEPKKTGCNRPSK